MTIYDQCSKISKTINEIYKREFLKNLHIRSLTEQNKEYKKLLKLEADKQEFFKLATAGAEPREYDKYFEDDDDEIEREARTTADQQEFLRLAAAAEREELEREARLTPAEQELEKEARLRAYADKGKEIVQRAVQTELNERRAREARAATEADDERAAIEAEAARAAAERAAAARAAAELKAAADKQAVIEAEAARAVELKAAIEADKRAAELKADKRAAELKADKQAALQVALQVATENVTKRQIAAEQKHEQRIQNAPKPTSSAGGTRRFKLKMNQTKRLKRGKKRRYNVTRTFKRRFTNRIDKLFILR